MDIYRGYKKHCTLRQFLDHHGETHVNVTRCLMWVRGRNQEGLWIYRLLQITACARRAFIGQHLVQLLDPEPESPSFFWVHSLTCLKRQFWGFTDKISFERSVYVVIDDQTYLLADIRPYLTLDRQSLIAGQDQIFTSPTKTHMFRLRKYRTPFDPEKSLRRSRKLLHRSIQKVVSAYHRDMDDEKEPFIDDVCHVVQKDVHKELSDLSTAYDHTWIGNVAERWNYSEDEPTLTSTNDLNV